MAGSARSSIRSKKNDSSATKTVHGNFVADPNTATVTDLEELETVFRTALEQDGPWFIVAKTQETDYLPVAPIEPELTMYRLRDSFAK